MLFTAFIFHHVLCGLIRPCLIQFWGFVYFIQPLLEKINEQYLSVVWLFLLRVFWFFVYLLCMQCCMPLQFVSSFWIHWVTSPYLPPV